MASFSSGKDEWSDETISRHPQILATCRQIYDEAIGVFNESIAYVSAAINLTKHPISVEPIPLLSHYQTMYSVEVRMDGRPILRCDTGRSTTPNPWPTSLERVRSLHIHVSLCEYQGITQSRREAGAKQANQTFLYLYRLLETSTNIKKVYVGIPTALDIEDDQHYSILSPLCALSAKVPIFNYTISARSTAFTNTCKKAIACYRTTKTFKIEIKLLADLLNLSVSHSVDGKLDNQPSQLELSLINVVESCDSVISAHHFDDIYSLPGVRHLMPTVKQVMRLLDHVFKQATEKNGMAVDDVVQRLKEKHDELQVAFDGLS